MTSGPRRNVIITISDVLMYWSQRELLEYVNHRLRVRGIHTVHETVKLPQLDLHLKVGVVGETTAEPGWDADGRPTEEWPA